MRIFVLCFTLKNYIVCIFKVARQRKDVFRLEQEREKLGGELSEAQNMYMQSLEDIKVCLNRAPAITTAEMRHSN